MSIHLADDSQARRIVKIQCLIAVTAAMIMLLWGWVPAYSALLGGLTAAVGNGVMALSVFTRYQAQKPGNLLARVYRGELAKILVTAVIFAGLFAMLKPVSVGALLGGYLLVAVAPIFVIHFSD